MSAAVTIVDYGMGNLLSVRRAFEHCGATVQFAEEARAIEQAKRLVLPGVGAFSDGMKGLVERGLAEPLIRFAGSGRPFLGICLGMQMMFSHSEEHGRQGGLGLIEGGVVAIPTRGPGDSSRKVPHIGWAAVQASSDWSASALSDAQPGKTSFYFVHSFHAQPDDRAKLLAICDYQGCAVTAAVAQDNLLGCQFHPEKSAASGLRVLKNWVSSAAMWRARNRDEEDGSGVA